MRDLHNQVNPTILFEPIAGQVNSDAARASFIIDRQGYDAVEFIIINGTNTDPDATFAVTVAESDAANMSGSNAVDSSQILGTLALASFTFADDQKCRKFGVIDTKRYLQVTVTPTGNNAGSWFMAGVALLGKGTVMPPSNPPA